MLRFLVDIKDFGHIVTLTADAAAEESIPRARQFISLPATWEQSAADEFTAADCARKLRELAAWIEANPR